MIWMKISNHTLLAERALGLRFTGRGFESRLGTIA